MINKALHIYRITIAIFVLCLLSTTLHAGAWTMTPDDDEETADTLAVDSMAASDGDEEMPWGEKIRTRIDRLLESSIFTTSMVGMEIYDLTGDSLLFAYNERQTLRPASTMKMIVAVTALDRLGSSYNYATSLYYKGERDSTTLHGDIYCKGGFDPAFGRSDMESFVEAVRGLGIDTIRGNIYADVSMKDKDRLGEGWCWDDDNPVLSPLLISEKDEFAIQLKNRLTRAGIMVCGDTEEGKLPHDAVEICRKERSIGSIMKRMMKRSDNLYAESMFYQLAAKEAGTHTPSARHGRQAVNRLVTKFGLKPSRYYIADGSGLSLYNYVSPHLEVMFLRHAFANKDIYDNLLPTMPVAGVDGTLSKRMRRGYAHGNVKAKTGTVTGISALAGYCTAANGNIICFSIMNSGIRHSSSGRNFQDRVCEALCKP